jgi:hypothetical protein
LSVAKRGFAKKAAEDVETVDAPDAEPNEDIVSRPRKPAEHYNEGYSHIGIGLDGSPNPSHIIRAVGSLNDTSDLDSKFGDKPYALGFSSKADVSNVSLPGCSSATLRFSVFAFDNLGTEGAFEGGDDAE